MKKIACIRLLKALALFIPIAALVLFLQSALFYHDDHNDERIRSFYREPPRSLDVVMLGASDVYAGFSPVYAYEYTGLTSYIYAYDSNPGSLYLSQLKEILKQQDPQLVVIEVNGFVHSEGHMTNESSLRHYVKNIPMSLNKLRTIWEYRYDDKLSCLIPFFKYHGEWSIPLEEMQAQFASRPRPVKVPNRLKGSCTQTGIDYHTTAYYDVTNDDITADLHPVTHAHLMDLLNYCRDHEIRNLLFVRFPHKITGERQYERFGRSNRVEEIVNEYGYDFLDLESGVDDLGIDQQYDFYNEEHLNIYGQQKLTEYLCDVLLDEYALSPMEQTAENRQHWDESIHYFHAYNEAVEELMEAGIDEQLYETPRLLRELEKRMI